ncbi:MAG: ubiquinol-cytochrome C chaperone [Alphaproteobacteria bacterium]|nr:ubiquinol-cytochrome C chaperone [Alphaproteobacteria bacterium]
MSWLFDRLQGRQRPPTGSIAAIYAVIVTQARQAVFYRDLRVPDSVEGRFDLLLLHLWLVLRRLRALSQKELSQALFDRFCEDMDDNLREMGIGDVALKKRMRKVGEAFYGRAHAYDQAMDHPAVEQGDDALAAVVCRNVFNGSEIGQAQRLAAYVRAAGRELNNFSEAAFRDASVRFPMPED